MTDLVAHGSAVALADTDDTGRSWIELLPAVTESRNGPYFFTVTPDDLNVYAQSLQARPGQVPVDYDHQGDVGKSTRAAGWFTGETQVVRAGDETPNGDPAAHDSTWAEVQWTPRAITEIRGGEFKFTSPVFTFRQKDPKTGLMTRAKEIVASTLTNRPHFKQMNAVMATDLYDESVLAALTDTYPEQVAHLIRSALTTDLADIARDLIDHPAVLATTKETPMFELKALASVLGLAEDATDEQITAAVTAAKTKSEELAAKVAELEAIEADTSSAAAKIAELEAKVAASEAERTAEKIEGALAQAVREGRIAPVSKDSLAESFEGNLEGLEKVLASFPVRKGLVGVAGVPEPDNDNEVEKVRAAHESKDGIPADEESAALHVAALKILGKDDYSIDEYGRALEQAERNAA